jgi:hypothetical protein
MNEDKIEWDKQLTPKLGTSDIMQSALDWWHNLPVQDLQVMDNSWVGYLWKYYPEKSHPYHLTTEEVKHIYESEYIGYNRLLDDDDKPFDKLEDADYLAEGWYPNKVVVCTKDGDKLCKADRSNAWQPDGAYSYFFYEVKK